MKYDLKKLVPSQEIELTWHGDRTRVLFPGDARKEGGNDGKVEVLTGATVKTTVEHAKFLLAYSPMWTLKGDKPGNEKKVVVVEPEAPAEETKPAEGDEETQDDEQGDEESEA